MQNDDDERREHDHPANPDPAPSTAQFLAIAAVEASEERRKAYEITRPRILSTMFDVGEPATIGDEPAAGG